MNVSFVVLHYITDKETIECVDSIFAGCSQGDINVVVVDNYSPNDSVRVLEEKYGGNPSVHILKNDENLGYARGNNVGYQYAKKQLAADFIILLGNDTVIKQKNFVQDIINIYEEHKPHILGPAIFSTSREYYQSPHRNHRLSRREVYWRVPIFKTIMFVIKLTSWQTAKKIIVLGKKTIRRFSKKEAAIYQRNWQDVQEDVVLHGACYVFTPLFVRAYKGLYDKTFMFMEEDILAYIAGKEKLKILYHPGLEVLHKEDAATDAAYTEIDAKMIFKYGYSIQSAKLLLNIMRDNNLYKSSVIDDHNPGLENRNGG